MATESVFDTYFRRQPAPARVGLVSLGHYLYWPQFDGLKDQLLGYHAEFAAQLADLGVEVIDVGMSDSPQCAGELADRLHAADVDLVIAFLATYTPSADVMPIAHRPSHGPAPGSGCPAAGHGAGLRQRHHLRPALQRQYLQPARNLLRAASRQPGAG